MAPTPGRATTANLANALRADAKGLYCAQAAAELLIAHHTWLTREDFTAQHIHIGHHLIDNTQLACIDYTAAIAALDTGRLPSSSGEQRMLRIAASLAQGIPVPLRDVLTGLDATSTDLIAAAVRHAGGRPWTPSSAKDHHSATPRPGEPSPQTKPHHPRV
jgi:hypothetical protein